MIQNKNSRPKDIYNQDKRFKKLEGNLAWEEGKLNQIIVYHDELLIEYHF